jgi:hypothetical protein
MDIAVPLINKVKPESRCTQLSSSESLNRLTSDSCTESLSCGDGGSSSSRSDSSDLTRASDNTGLPFRFGGEEWMLVWDAVGADFFAAAPPTTSSLA